jgi:hypothetical protein
MKRARTKNKANAKNQQTPEEFNAAKQKELWDRVDQEINTYDGKNFFEQYGLYMLRVQMYELSLKQDLHQLFGVPEEKTDRMNFSSIFRYYIKHDIRAHPILYVNVVDIAKQRNAMAHEFLAVTVSIGDLAGEAAQRLSERQLSSWVRELELAFQQYVMLKEMGTLYQDYRYKPQNPGDDGRCYVRAKKKGSTDR